MNSEIQYASNAGREYAEQIAADVVNHQSGPGKYESSQDLPEADYLDLNLKFGSVTPEMEKAYRTGYNSVSDNEEMQIGNK